MKNKTINNYYEFLDKQKEERFKMLQSTMISTHEQLVHELLKKGWSQKGKGTVTDTMTKSNILKFDFVKEYKGEKVILNININFGEDFGDDGYKQISIKGSKPIKVPFWGKGGFWSPLDYEERNTYSGDGRFLLENQLDLIDKTYNT